MKQAYRNQYQYVYQIAGPLWLTDWPVIAWFVLMLLLFRSWYRCRQLQQTIYQQQDDLNQLRAQVRAGEEELARALCPPDPPAAPGLLVFGADQTDEFLLRVREFVTAHLAESELSVEVLATAMHMSRMNLHRKLKAQTGLSANELIRAVRLQKAAELLLTDMPVSTVAYTVGIESPAYFSRIFREEFDCTPSDYVLLNRIKK
jgi:AraC-like DNA-binding protein